MIGVSGGDHRVIGVELEKGTVVFVSLNNDPFALAVDEHVAVKILRYSTEEGATTERAFVQEVSNHSRCGSLTVASSHSDTFLANG